MIEVNYKTMAICILIIFVLAILIGFTISSGCVSTAKGIGKSLMATPTPTPTAAVPEIPKTPTPKQTPKTVPTFQAKYVDPYLQGERWEGQWFKFLRNDVAGLQDLNVGFIVYRHLWLDKYTWYNGATGNFYEQKPSKENYRYLFIFVHQEMFGDNQTYDPRLWSFDESAFRIQFQGNTYQNDVYNHNPVNIILEMKTRYNYYDDSITTAYGYERIYTGNNPEQGGWDAQRIPWLYMGEGNSIDGYLIYEVPKSASDEDILVLGSFSRFGSAYWHLLGDYTS